MKLVHDFAHSYQQKYHIKTMNILEKLEKEIGFQIEKYKMVDNNEEISFLVLDQLDRRLYDTFMGLKSEFNKYSPLSQDRKLMLMV